MQRTRMEQRQAEQKNSRSSVWETANSARMENNGTEGARRPIGTTIYQQLLLSATVADGNADRTRVELLSSRRFQYRQKLHSLAVKRIRCFSYYSYPFLINIEKTRRSKQCRNFAKGLVCQVVGAHFVWKMISIVIKSKDRRIDSA